MDYMNENMIEDVYNDNTDLIDIAMTAYIISLFNKGVKKASTILNLKRFAVFKNYHVKKDLRDLKKLNPDISLEDFKESGKAITNIYNKAYLKAELETTAIMNSNMIEFTPVFESEYVKRICVQDEKLRETHKEAGDIVRLSSDPYWSQNLPPYLNSNLEYNCRCKVVPASQDEIKNLVKVENKASNNYLKTGIYFNAQHPYFNVSYRIKKELNKIIKDI